GALARHADDATLRTRRQSTPADGRRRPLLRLPLRRHRASGARLRRRDAGARLRRRDLVGVDHLELAVLGHRVLELLAEEVLVQQDVHVRRKRVRVLALKEHDGARVLLAAEDQLRFLLALGRRLPRGQGHGEEDRHDGHGGEQCRHGEAVACVGHPQCHLKLNSTRPLPLRPSVVVTVTVAVVGPADALVPYTCVVLLVVVVASMLPSFSKSHANDCASPPVTVAVNVSVTGRAPSPGDTVKSTVIGPRGVIVTFEDAVVVSLFTSVARTVAV